MGDPNCRHETLYFGSGDYYVFCRGCDACWMRRGKFPEYGIDADGQKIGADPLEANVGVGGLQSGRDRVAEK